METPLLDWKRGQKWRCGFIKLATADEFVRYKYLVTELEHEIGGDDKTWFDLSQESDGTLRVLGISKTQRLGLNHELATQGLIAKLLTK
jgi:hypothetical protein